jgi:hypothetical protein
MGKEKTREIRIKNPFYPIKADAFSSLFCQLAKQIVIVSPFSATFLKYDNF